jgi:(S)-2-hydroxyglutarate dehydrogenase
VPDPRYPFLGVHLTRTVDGRVLVGPNAVLATAREGYRLRQVRFGELAETLRSPGFRRMAGRHWRTGAAELRRSLSRRGFAAAARRYVPALQSADLLRTRSGVRAQAVGADGELLQDFCIRQVGRVLNVRNAPSPAATSSLAIADELAARVRAMTPG